MDCETLRYGTSDFCRGPGRLGNTLHVDREFEFHKCIFDHRIISNFKKPRILEIELRILVTLLVSSDRLLAKKIE